MLRPGCGRETAQLCANTVPVRLQWILHGRLGRKCGARVRLLRAIGASRRQVLSSVLSEGVLLGVGVTVAVVVTVPVTVGSGVGPSVAVAVGVGVGRRLLWPGDGG